VDDEKGPYLPMLISKSTMKTLKVKLDLVKDVTTILGKNCKLDESSAGHYAVNLLDLPQDDKPTREYFLSEFWTLQKSKELKTETVFKTDSNTLRRQIQQIHDRFGHPGSNRLINLLQRAGYNDRALMVRDVSANCEVCSRHAKPAMIPLVCTRTSWTFNETVAVDIAFVDKVPMPIIAENHRPQYKVHAGGVVAQQDLSGGDGSN